jgi:putative acetyltransferase
MHIRPETPGDAPAIAALNREAFGGPYEAALIDRLRAGNLLAISLVGIESGLIVGHILFSELGLELDGRPVRAVALAPMCVATDRQRRGLGSALLRAGLQGVSEAGYAAVIVLGHPEFYPRFGFSPALAEKLESPFRGSAFMALELVPGALAGGIGNVTYPAAFDQP